MIFRTISRSASVALLCLGLALPPAAAGAGATIDTPAEPPPANALLLDVTGAGGRLVAVGEYGRVLLSDDRGDSWRQADSVPTGQMLTAVYFIDPEHGWAVGHDGLVLASDDGGSTWRVQRDGLAEQQRLNGAARERAAGEVRRLRAALEHAAAADREQLQSGLDEALLDLEDAELALAEPVYTSPLLDVWFADRQHGWAVGAFGTLLATGDGGRTWTDAAPLLSNPDEYHLNTVTGDADGGLYIAGESGSLYRSLDGGGRWERLAPIYDGSWFGIVREPVGSALLVFGLRGHLYRSTDRGTSWQRIITGSDMTLAGGSADGTGSVVLVGAGGTVLYSHDSGRSFIVDTVADGLNLSAGLRRAGRIVVVGQGGISVLTEGDGRE